MGYIPNFYIMCSSWERFEVREGVGKREFSVEDVINTPREEGSEELAPNVGNRGCPRWGCRGIEGTEVVSRSESYSRRVRNPFLSTKLRIEIKYPYFLNMPIMVYLYYTLTD